MRCLNHWHTLHFPFCGPWYFFSVFWSQDVKVILLRKVQLKIQQLLRLELHLISSYCLFVCPRQDLIYLQNIHKTAILEVLWASKNVATATDQNLVLRVRINRPFPILPLASVSKWVLVKRSLIYIKNTSVDERNFHKNGFVRRLVLIQAKGNLETVYWVEVGVVIMILKYFSAPIAGLCC